MKYAIDLSFTASATIEVEVPEGSEDPVEDAIEAALKKAGEPTAYAGNGSCAALAGFRGHAIDLSVSEVSVDTVNELT